MGDPWERVRDPAGDYPHAAYTGAGAVCSLTQVQISDVGGELGRAPAPGPARPDIAAATTSASWKEMPEALAW